MKKEPPLYLEMLKFQKYLFLVVNNFTKQYKKNLGNDIIALGWEVLDAIVDANEAPNAEKYIFLRKGSVSFDKLKMRLRFGYEVKIVPDKRYAVIVKDLENIGSMLFGWLKWAEEKRSK